MESAIEQPVEQPAEQSAEQSVEQSVEQPVEQVPPPTSDESGEPDVGGDATSSSPPELYLPIVAYAAPAQVQTLPMPTKGGELTDFVYLPVLQR